MQPASLPADAPQPLSLKPRTAVPIEHPTDTTAEPVAESRPAKPGLRPQDPGLYLEYSDIRSDDRLQARDFLTAPVDHYEPPHRIPGPDLMQPAATFQTPAFVTEPLKRAIADRFDAPEIADSPTVLMALVRGIVHRAKQKRAERKQRRRYPGIDHVPVASEIRATQLETLKEDTQLKSIIVILDTGKSPRITRSDQLEEEIAAHNLQGGPVRIVRLGIGNRDDAWAYQLWKGLEADASGEKPDVLYIDVATNRYSTSLFPTWNRKSVSPLLYLLNESHPEQGKELPTKAMLKAQMGDRDVKKETKPTSQCEEVAESEETADFSSCNLGNTVGRPGGFQDIGLRIGLESD